MKKIITYGTFDLFHRGHLELLRRAKELGDYLVVGVSTDEFNKRKGKECIYPFKDRFKIVESIKYVDKVIKEDSWKQKQKDIFSNNINIFVMGDDWDGKFDMLNNYCEVRYLKRTTVISTTSLKKYIKN